MVDINYTIDDAKFIEKPDFSELTPADFEEIANALGDPGMKFEHLNRRLAGLGARLTHLIQSGVRESDPGDLARADDILGKAGEVLDVLHRACLSTKLDFQSAATGADGTEVHHYSFDPGFAAEVEMSITDILESALMFKEQKLSLPWDREALSLTFPTYGFDSPIDSGPRVQFSIPSQAYDSHREAKKVLGADVELTSGADVLIAAALTLYKQEKGLALSASEEAMLRILEDGGEILANDGSIFYRDGRLSARKEPLPLRENIYLAVRE